MRPDGRSGGTPHGSHAQRSSANNPPLRGDRSHASVKRKRMLHGRAAPRGHAEQEKVGGQGRRTVETVHDAPTPGVLSMRLLALASRVVRTISMTDRMARSATPLSWWT